MKRLFARALTRRASGKVRLRAGAGTAARLLALLLASAVLNMTAAHANASPGGARSYTGELTVASGANIDGTPAVNGQTLFTGSTVETNRDSHSFINLGPLGRVELTPRTSLVLDFGEAGTSCALGAGRVRVYAPVAVGASVTTSDAAVSSSGEAGAVFSVATAKGATTVVVQSGQAEVKAGGVSRRLAAGETFTTAPQGAGRNNLSDGERKGLYAAIAAAVAVVIIVLAARSGDDEQFNGCIDVISGQSTCF
jgi:hypothetical protein